MNVKSFIHQIGRDTFAAETGFSQQVISRAITDDLMPAAWFVRVRDLAKRQGVEAPEHLFRWVHNRRPPTGAT